MVVGSEHRATDNLCAPHAGRPPAVRYRTLAQLRLPNHCGGVSINPWSINERGAESAVSAIIKWNSLFNLKETGQLFWSVVVRGTDTQSVFYTEQGPLKNPQEENMQSEKNGWQQPTSPLSQFKGFSWMQLIKLSACCQNLSQRSPRHVPILGTVECERWMCLVTLSCPAHPSISSLPNRKSFYPIRFRQNQHLTWTWWQPVVETWGLQPSTPTPERDTNTFVL